MAKPNDTVQQLTATLRGILPLPITEESIADGVLLTAGEPGLVSVNVSQRGMMVSVFAIRWDGPYTAVRNDREVCSLSWQELPDEVSQQTVIAFSLIHAAVLIRRATFRICKYCNETNPPEWQHSDDVCRGCAEKHLGVVH